MCGINGFNWRDEELIKGMNSTLSHRGPDGSDFYTCDMCSLGHTRLSIIDLDNRASQPMKSIDGRYIIVFNGEIYNYNELKSGLLSEYTYTTSSDTEVIIAAYGKWGKECVKYLDGMFAFVIYDNKTGELYLARDIQGIKPLYYYFNDGKLIFSSEIKSILCHDVARKLNLNSFYLYLHLLYVPEPDTLIIGINKLPQATYAIFKNGKLDITQYWSRSDAPKKLLTNKELEQKIDEAVKSQLVSDRPVGVYLSGGIDSTIILDSVSKITKNINTFSVGFTLNANEESIKFNKDFNLARETSSIYNTIHNELMVSADDLIVNLDKMVWHMDEPISNPTALPLFLLSEFSKDKVAVVLSGDGGDELFGGYDRYRFAIIMQKINLVPRFIKSILIHFGIGKGYFYTEESEIIQKFMSQKSEFINKVINKKIALNFSITNFFKDKYRMSFGERFLNRFLDFDRANWLVDFDLMLADKMSMAHGLEVRVPFLDKIIIESSTYIKTKDLVSLNSTKKMLKDSFRDRLPEYLFNLPKRGFFSPGSKWLRDEKVKSHLFHYLTADYYQETSNLLDWKEIDLLVKDHLNNKSYNLNIIWPIVVFQSWAKQYKIRL